MKQVLDRIYAVVAYVHALIDERQFEKAYEKHERGEAGSVLQGLLDEGWLRNADRKPLESKVCSYLVRAADALLVNDEAARIRQRLRNDPVWRDAFVGYDGAGLDLRGRYRLLKVIGQGGMGRVWLARDEVLGRSVALKELTPPGMDNPKARARFLREARITGRLEHPFIVPIYELQADGMLHYVMRLVHGVPLGEAIASFHARGSSRGHGDLLRLLAVFRSICEAIAFAHTRGVVHRDLKPENVRLGSFGEVYVLDWGLSKIIAGEEDAAEKDVEATEELTARGQALGTPEYMSPEQAAGRSREAQPAMDIFGLGGILFAILTGSGPHARHASLPLPEKLRRVATEPAPRAGEVRPDVPVALEAICAKALAVDPSNRYAQALDLAEDVRRWTAGESVSAYREPRTAKLRRWALEHPRRTLAGVAAVVGFAVALTAFGVAAWREEAAGQRHLQRELVTRAQMLRHDLLTDVALATSGLKGDAGSPLLRALVTGESLDGSWGEARRRQARFWESWLRARGYFLSLALVDRKNPERSLVRVKRPSYGADLTVLLPEDAKPDADKAAAEVLAQVDLGLGPHFVRRTLPDGSMQVALVTVARIDAPNHDAWLVSEFDFTWTTQDMVVPDDPEIVTVLRDSQGRVLVKGGTAADVSPYAAEPLGDAIDPRLREYLAAREIPPPADSGAGRSPFALRGDNGGLTLTSAEPNRDTVHAARVHYNPGVDDGYVTVTITAPDELHAPSVARRNFLIAIAVLMLVTVLAVGLLAGGVFRKTNTVSRETV